MNIIRAKSCLQIPMALAVVMILALALRAGAASTWNNAAGGYWSVPGNWSPSGAPGSATDVIFGDVGAGQSTTNDILSESIDSLTYDQDDSLQQTTVIKAGQTLTVNSSIAAGSALLSVGSTSASITTTTIVGAAIQGGNTTGLNLNGAGDIWVSQGFSSASSHYAELDLSQIGTLTATIGRLWVGVNVNGNNRPAGILNLALTNNITLTGGAPQVEVGNASSNGNIGETTSALNLGQQNVLLADTWRVGGDKCQASISFNSAIVNSPSLRIRNTDNASPCTVIDFGDNSEAGPTGTSESLTADFSLGTVDIYANLMHIPQGQSGSTSGTTSESGTATSTVTFGAGTVNVPDLEIGYGNASNPNASTGATTGTLNVNNNGLFSTGAVVVASTMLRLARTNGGNSVITGTLNINNGEVIANSIVSGGGVSAVNLNAGSLTVSNTAGSLAFPIRTMTIGQSGGTTLNVPVSTSGATMVVSNLTTGGSAGNNLINIISVPPIASYPATFPIIQYSGAEGGSGSGTFAINSLPAASPAYVGTIVDTENGAVQLQLTHGPVAILAETWTGAISGDWDTSTYNWLFQGHATNFFTSANTLFTDSASQTNISLDLALSPGTITVSNNVAQFTFAGSGYIAGAATLTKFGSSSLALDNTGGNNNINTVVVNAGTLQIGEGDANGGLATVNITNNGTLVFDRTDDVALSSPIVGTGGLEQIGGGTLVLSGASSYSGATMVTNGTLEIDGTLGTGSVMSTAGTTLAGGGTVGGPVTVGGQFAPGPSGGFGTFTAGDGLTLSSGSTLTFGLSAANPPSSDTVAVTGNLSVNNNTITVNFDGPPAGGAQYVLFTYTGTLSGSFNPVVQGTHFTTAIDTSSTPGTVYLDITSGSGYELDWASTSDPTWNAINTNWVNLNTLLPSTFANGDSVLFDDTPGVVTTINIPAGVSVAPASFTDTATNNYFTISGSGQISGPTGIILSGLSTLAIDTANTFTGPVDIQQGILQTGNGAALGNASSVTVENGATLDTDGQNLGGTLITASGAGFGGQGAIINSAGAQAQTLRQILLVGDTTIGGAGNWEMNNSGGAASLSTGGEPFNLTKVGGNTITLENLTTFDVALANIDIQAGTLLFNGITPDMGDPTQTLTVETGASLAFGSDNIVWNKQFVFNGDGSTLTVNAEGGANDVLAGPVTLNGDVVFDVTGTQLIVSNTVSGSGGVVKEGGSPLIFAGATTYTGDTTLDSAALRLMAPADLSGSTNITINAGSTLTVTGMVNSTFILYTNQNLTGNGVVNGKLTANAGSTIQPGVNGAVGVLTVSNAIVLAGTNVMKLDPANGTNDMLLSGSGPITYGGILNLVDISTPLASGDTFTLFSAPGYSGSFAAIVPATPGSGLAWNTSALATSGTISVVSAAPLNFGSIKTVGGNVVFTGSGGTALGTYYVLTSTNLTTPLPDWTSIATNSFDGSGNFAFTNSLNPYVPQRFYRIETP